MSDSAEPQSIHKKTNLLWQPCQYSPELSRQLYPTNLTSDIYIFLLLCINRETYYIISSYTYYTLWVYMWQCLP